ncbi:hypothetical protein HF086_011115 [Spodoptera exigua]|uniref:Fatty acyl-CoA reductase n=1 Tax=Spodoptera exigua TaxID=7107 RepID=A0A922MZ51_SPOEX|nr:hypothetical protein HF086_011115 [Spodoptera exigua]
MSVVSWTRHVFSKRLKNSVLSSLREPVKGWVDNWNGPNGIIAAVGKGIFRTMLGTGTKVADLVPVDTVINLMIVCAWRTHLRRMVRVQNKLEKAAACLEYFTTRQWAFADDNVQALCASLSPDDRRLHIVHILTQVATVFFLWRFLFSRSNALRSIWRRVLELLTRAARLLAIA